MVQVGGVTFGMAVGAAKGLVLSAYNRSMQFSAIITRDGDWFVAQCREVDVASQGATEEEARANLAEALTLYFEGTDTAAGPSPVVAPSDVAV